MAHQRIHLEHPELMSIKEVTWEQVKSSVTRANPQLADIIEELKPPKSHTLVLARYPYGVDIRRKGIGYFPSEKKHVGVTRCATNVTPDP